MAILNSYLKLPDGRSCYHPVLMEHLKMEEIADHSNLESSEVKERCVFFTIIGRDIKHEYPLVVTNMAIENGHRNSGFTN